MNTQKEILPHIFSSLLRLEKKLAIIKASTPKKGRLAIKVEYDLAQHLKILRQMRRIANQLQFAIAHKNQVETAKLLKVYYALNQMVRPEINTNLHSSSKTRLRAVQNAH